MNTNNYFIQIEGNGDDHGKWYKEMLENYGLTGAKEGDEFTLIVCEVKDHSINLKFKKLNK